MKNKDDIEKHLQAVRKRFSELNENQRDPFIAHLRSMAKWHHDAQDYPEPKNINFPSTIHVAYAVCHPSCGTREFIVDGSTQECQACGALMFRTEVVEYSRKKQKRGGKGAKQPNQAL